MADTFIDDLDWLPDELITSTKLNQWWANMQNFHNGTALGDGIIVTRHINAGAVTPDKLQSGTGSSWEWQAWTPTVEGYSGTPSIQCKYIQIGKTVHVKVFINGTSNNSQKFISLPVPADTTIDPVFLGLAYTNGANGDRIGAIMLRPGDGKIQIYCGFSQSAGSGLFTGWATSGDAGFRFTVTYEAA